jgi:N-acetylneuraminic acid mutarotase
MSVVAVLLAGIQPLSAQIQGQWTSTGAMQSTRELGAHVLLVSGNVLTIGGVDNSNNVLAAAEVYNPGAGTWKGTGSMARPRQQFAAVVLKGGKVLVSGGLGVSSIVLSGSELYNPTTGTWSAAGSLFVPRFGHTATLLPSGKILVTGGCTSSSCATDTAVSEFYDPTTNTWSATGNLNTARRYHTAVLLQTGKVLVIGGYNASAITSCELYNPSVGTWTAAASTNVARYLNGTTLLSDGKVLATGGPLASIPKLQRNSTTLLPIPGR